jgi:hypothetical protein
MLLVEYVEIQIILKMEQINVYSQSNMKDVYGVYKSKD